MQKNKVLIRLLLALCGMLILVITVGVAYYLGAQRQSTQLQLAQSEQAIRDHEYGKTLESMRKERNRAIVNYETACLEYQKLHITYEELYDEFGAIIEIPRYISPDSARGNEESCYR